MIMVVLSILIPAMINLVRKDSKDNQRESKKSKSLHLAEAGLDRGAWKLRESADIWTTASSGTAISGYNNDVEYTDIEGGRYKIRILSGPSTNEVTVIAKGKADGSDEIRAIQAVFSKDAAAALPALSVNSGITWKPNMRVHWGPVITYNSITQSPGDYYPRKYSAGQIVGRDTVNDANNGAMPADNWTTYDYAAFYDLGVAPTIKLDKYRELAKATNLSVFGITLRKGTGSSVASHDTSNGYDSGYYTENVKIQKPGGGANNVTLNCPTCVIFIEGQVVSFPNDAWLNVKALVATGNVDYNGDCCSYTATIPDDASEEYQHSSLGTYFTNQGWTDGGTASISSVGMRGFLYVGGNFTNAGGGAKLIGSIFVVGSVSINTLIIYYDDDVAASVETGGSGPMERLSWDEISTSW